jgi:hypothetical protein
MQTAIDVRAGQTVVVDARSAETVPEAHEAQRLFDPAPAPMAGQLTLSPKDPS